MLVGAVVGLSKGTVLNSLEEMFGALTPCWGDLDRLSAMGECLAGGVDSLEVLRC